MTKEPTSSLGAAPHTGRRRGPRQDVARNKSALIDATGQLLIEDPELATMPAIAERAGLSVATAYRYFSTLDELHREYLLNVVDQLAKFSQESTLEGIDLFEAVLGRWLDLVTSHGPAMVKIRSREGFLHRLQQGERHSMILDSAWSRPVHAMMRLEGVADDQYEYALHLMNALFNSRELLDLHSRLKRAPSRLVRDLTEVYRATLHGLSRTSFGIG